MTAFIDFQFHAKITIACAIENGIGFVAVIANRTVFTPVITVIAVSVVIIIIKVIRVIKGNNSSAILAGRVMIVVAFLTERVIAVSCVVLVPKPVVAMFAQKSLASPAIAAHNIAVKPECVFVFAYPISALGTGASVWSS